ncbi:S8 family serine peptidase [Micromonospora sp. NPDC047548]|uniref:S8 family serine peptidase n=1 Tax=Micromonospora sp. NPDC047548 TaxID=3155624 RepID=UPI0033F5B057
MQQQTQAGGEATFWVVMDSQAQLSQAPEIKDWSGRGNYVHSTLRDKAKSTQAGIASMLKSKGAHYTSFWINNSIQVKGDASLVHELAAQPGVKRIEQDHTVMLPEPIKGEDQPEVESVEWNIDRVRAPDVWQQFGDRGEGIVVGNIDSGVQYDHAALVNKYRGHRTDGSFDHNYNWYDPTHDCAGNIPCDNHGHGTHTMGTMVGDGGQGNQIGVAPGATWIAAKGCENRGCPQAALLSSGQWMLAPTDLNGQNPRPELRPDVINNSWGGNIGGGNDWYRDVVRAWVAAGIFPVFSNGNAGPACDTPGDPADYPESYAVGASDINNAIASFSSRGPGAYGVIKPDISAPGANVRSSLPGGGYGSMSGTSMAAPHLAATIALIWSAAPSLRGDVAGTRAMLDGTAIDVDDTSCGGTAGDNNVWGEGRLDAFAAVDASPRGPWGTLTGTVTDAGTGGPIVGATVEASGLQGRTASTGAGGTFNLRLPVGDHHMSAVAFGYLKSEADITITEGQETAQSFALTAAPSHAVRGTVTDDGGNPVAGAHGHHRRHTGPARDHRWLRPVRLRPRSGGLLPTVVRGGRLCRLGDEGAGRRR